MRPRILHIRARGVMIGDPGPRRGRFPDRKIRLQRHAIVATLGAVLLLASRPAMASPAPLAPQVDALFAGLNDKTPGCVVAVSRNGELLTQRAYGMASLELNAPITPATVFEAGSASKQFVAATILLLVREGRIALSDDIRRYLPEMPDYGSVITVADLLHHTSGLRDWGSLAMMQGWPRNSRTADNADVLSIVSRQKALNFVPGTHFLYSNSNYNLLVIIAERVTGQPLDEVARARIFAPLGMTHTRWRSDYQDIVPGRAAAYAHDARGYYNDQVIENAFGNGGLLTTIGDLALWQEALDHSTLGPGFTEQMQSKGTLRDGRAVGYGLGLYITAYRGLLEVYHEGITGGYHSWVARYPERRLAIRMLCNGVDIPTRPLGRRIADLLLPPPPPAPSVPLQPIRSGTYADLLTGIPIRIATDAGDALIVDGHRAAPAGPNRWQIGDDFFDFSDGTFVRETVQGERFRYRPVTATGGPPSADEAGRYCSTEAGTCFVIRSGAGGLTLTGPRGPARPLLPAYDGVFTGSIYPDERKLTIFFERAPGGAVTGFHASDQSAYGVSFTKEP